jgi:hypothetical protein
MNDADHLDPSRARSDFQRCIIELRNDHASWPTIARTMGSTIRIVRASWGRANHEQRGGHTQPTPTTTREDATIGNEALLRGIPVAGIGGGAIHGTRPGDRALPEPPPARRRRAS